MVITNTYVYILDGLHHSDVYHNGVGLIFFDSSLNCDCAEVRFLADPTKTIRYCKNRAFDIYIRNLRDDGFVADSYRV